MCHLIDLFVLGDIIFFVINIVKPKFGFPRRKIADVPTARAVPTARFPCIHFAIKLFITTE